MPWGWGMTAAMAEDEGEVTVHVRLSRPQGDALCAPGKSRLAIAPFGLVFSSAAAHTRVPASAPLPAHPPRSGYPSRTLCHLPLVHPPRTVSP